MHSSPIFFFLLKKISFFNFKKFLYNFWRSFAYAIGTLSWPLQVMTHVHACTHIYLCMCICHRLTYIMKNL